MIFFTITDKKVNPTDLKTHLAKNNIRAFISPNIEDSNRLVTHHYIRDAQIE